MNGFRVGFQHDSMQCGIACLQMVCKYFGREYSLDSLSKLCFATTEGVSLLGINEAANTLGLHTTSARVTTTVLSDVPLPCILHWNQNHFVVLYKVKNGKKFYIADPGKGLITYRLDEFKQHWISTKSNDEDKGIAMFLETTPTFFTYKMQDEENIKEKAVFPLSLWICEEIPQVFRTNHLGFDSREPLTTCPAIPYTINRGCRYQEPRYRIRLAYTVGTVDAYHQQNCNRLYTQMVVATHISAHQHIVGERLLHQTFEAADVFL